MVKHVHHKPVFSGALSGACLDNATATGQAIITVLNNPHDSHFVAGTYKGTYGSVVIDAAGNYVYTPDATNVAVSGLATGATLNDSVQVRDVYTYRGIVGPVLTFVITGN